MACRHAMKAVLALLAFSTAFVRSQDPETSSPPSSFPHQYPNQPTRELSPEWQTYFEVTEPLPNVTFPLGRSFAGNIPVQRPGHPNDTLFFVAFEHQNGSLTAAADENNTDPWGIWLNGGPGSSSLFGLFFENGPIRIGGDYSILPNNYSWDRLADYFWVDQPVGVGYSTADEDGYVADEDQVGVDFMGFLGNLVKVFPSLATRPLYLTGESYAGMYIPYILKAYFNMEEPPVRIAKIVIGDGTITDGPVFELLPAFSVVETFPQLIGYDVDVYEYLKEQNHLCGYDLNLTYPQDGILPPVPLVLPTARVVPGFEQHQFTNKKKFLSKLFSRAAALEAEVNELEKIDRVEKRGGLAKRAWIEEREEKRLEFKRDIGERQNGTLDPWYGCLILDFFIDYAINYTYPWNLTQGTDYFGFNVYDVPDALVPRVNTDASVFLNDEQTRRALHAPTSKDWTLISPFVFATEGSFDPSPFPMVFMTELATNATANDVGIVLYSGNNDAVVAHLSTEIAIQASRNTTFGGIQGFTRKPSTPWNDDNGEFAGIIHQERNWTYALFYGASHLVPASVPVAAFTFFREFVLGSNEIGLVVSDDDGATRVIGGQDPALAGTVLPGADAIYMGSGTTESTYFWPQRTVDAWREYIATETAAPGNTIGTAGSAGDVNGANVISRASRAWGVGVGVAVVAHNLL
ncbi:hypothetical protein AX16_001723 [Volvariella volvacea WC 439]|nr:hypothetical protein AX16_001723 [Volvariella volvacea WC 439]